MHGSPRLNDGLRRKMLRQMLDIRFCEERIQRLFEEGLVRGSTHLCIGQEAVSVGAAAAVEPERGDTVLCTYRGHGMALALGMSLHSLLAELMGRQGGCCGGKGGSMHLTDVDHGLLGTFAIVGAHIPIAAGAALSAQIRKSGAVSLAVFGDGAVNNGAWHEAVNLAAVWKLPVVLLCENNLYGEYTPFAQTSPVPHVADRAAAYGIPAEIVDGQDADEMFRAVRGAVRRARQGGGPSLIEAKTYRFVGHSRTDPATYRPQGELEKWRQRDPIRILASRLQMSESELKEEEERARARVESALQWAVQQPEPPVESLREGILA
ncbi:MAG: thiamine pyrophosphate-dependent dehydrogenase E1 component subunit alpha [Armatimonadota bacterium]